MRVFKVKKVIYLEIAEEDEVDKETLRKFLHDGEYDVLFEEYQNHVNYEITEVKHRKKFYDEDLSEEM